MTLRNFLLPAAALAAVATAVPAMAAITVLGNSAARLCYEAAESKSLGGQGLGQCNRALRDENLSTRDAVATFVNRGILKLRGGDTEAAIIDFDNAIDMNPAEAEAYLNKGVATLRLGDGERRTEAVRLFDTALAKNTKKPAIAYYGRAIAHELSGRLREAYRDYRQASAAAPEWREPKAELSRFTVR
ncbi:MAG TPA: tetratricopeptide repeat protein [Allosphingosinicella sp.]|jgi:tetratricopeptide (TPR) repeat protein|nr:tetratricopeptide repeat protein [Allosphingosinicella sp.]